jgi:hypothetical protein
VANEICAECGKPGADSARMGEHGKATWLHSACLLKQRSAERLAEQAQDRAWHYTNRTASRNRLIEARKQLQAAGIDTKGLSDADIIERSQEITNEPANA